MVSQIVPLYRCKDVKVMGMASRWAEAEFETIFRTHFERMARMARRVLRSDAEAEEVCAEAFLKLFRSGPGVLEGGLVGGWLYRTVTRAAIDILRRSRRRGVEEEFDASAGVPAATEPDDPMTRMLRAERIAEVRASLAKMKREKAQILLLRHSGLSYRKIAEAMRINANSVGTLLARAEAEFGKIYASHPFRPLRRAEKDGARREVRDAKESTRLEAAKEGQ
jgi:RNA polymerase sigma factor (sigma-70 family)